MKAAKQQTHKTRIMATAFALMLTGCGNVLNWSDDSNDEDESEPVPTEPKTFQGFVGGSFEVTVDGAPYLEMEDFYTQEVERLPEKVLKAGYDASWEARFEAEVGLSDLWREMTVYIAPLDSRGFQAQTWVDESGGFAVTLPPEALNHTYKIRANKRISIILSRGETQKKICYNFSAVEKSAPFDDESLPIVLDNFVTSITAYACAEGNSDGLEVPPSPSQPTMLALGQTKADVTRILGVEGLTVESPLNWCWAHRPLADSPCAADVADTTCDCQVTFDQGGVVTAMTGVSASYLAD